MAGDNLNALSQGVDPEKVLVVNDRVGALSKEVEEMVDKIVAEVCLELDEYMKMIDDRLINSQKAPISDYDLDMFVMNLPSILYTVSSQQENLGIREDVARAVRNEVYNRVREKAQGTVADKDTAAELQSQSESVVNIVYSRAYRKVKLRVESAWEMMNSIKKVISRRVSEYDLNAQDRGGVR